MIFKNKLMKFMTNLITISKKLKIKFIKQKIKKILTLLEIFIKKKLKKENSFLMNLKLQKKNGMQKKINQKNFLTNHKNLDKK